MNTQCANARGRCRMQAGCTLEGYAGTLVRPGTALDIFRAARVKEYFRCAMNSLAYRARFCRHADRFALRWICNMAPICGAVPRIAWSRDGLRDTAWHTGQRYPHKMRDGRNSRHTPAHPAQRA